MIEHGDAPQHLPSFNSLTGIQPRFEPTPSAAAGSTGQGEITVPDGAPYAHGLDTPLRPEVPATIEQSERPQRPVTIEQSHGETFIIAANADPVLVANSRALMHDVADPYRRHAGHPGSGIGSLPVHYEGGPSSRRWHSDIGHTVFVRERNGASAAHYEEALFWLAGAPTHDVTDSPIDTSSERAAAQEHLSVLHEMNMARAVNRHLSETQLQEAVRLAGFTGVTAVEPISAMIRQQDGQRVVAYPFIEGQAYAPGRQEQRPPHDMEARLQTVAGYIGERLMREGIVPYDLSTAKFIIARRENGQQLHLIGMEHYSSRVNPESNVFQDNPQAQQRPLRAETTRTTLHDGI